MNDRKISLSIPPFCFRGYQFHPLMLVALAGLILIGMMATPASAAPLVWRSNDFESGASWFTGGTITTDEALSPTHSLNFGGSNSFHEYKPFAEMPTLQSGESFGSFVFTIWVNDVNNGSQSYQRGIRFSKPDNSGETSYSTSSYSNIGSGWNQLNFNFTAAANSNYAAGRTKISRAYIRANNSGTYVPYYVDDASFTYTIIPEPTTAGLLFGSLGVVLLFGRRRRIV